MKRSILVLLLAAPLAAHAGTILEGDYIRIQYNGWGGWNDDTPEYSGLMIRAAATDEWIDDVTIPGSPWQQNTWEFDWSGYTWFTDMANYSYWGGYGSPWYNEVTGAYEDVTETNLSTSTTQAIQHDWNLGPLEISKLESFPVDGKVIQITWTVTNTSEIAVQNLRVMHAFDPDMDVYRFDTYDTYNDSIDISGDGVNDFVYSEGWVSGWSIAYGGCELDASDIGHQDWVDDADAVFADMDRTDMPFEYTDVTMHWRYRHGVDLGPGETITFSARLLWDVTTVDAVELFIETAPECGLCDIDGDGHEALACGGDDCDDTNAASYPGAEELPGDGIDGDCDGTEICYPDEDRDGYGIDGPYLSENIACDGDGESPYNTDCDDIHPAIHPDAEEWPADGQDRDCDGGDLCWLDKDGDTFGSTETVLSEDLSCVEVGESETDDDCDDMDETLYPGAPEVVGDGRDQDCDGLDACYADLDGDGFAGLATVASEDGDCDDPGEGALPLDCDDEDSSVNPDALESPGDEVDQDCDGGELCWVDGDGDAWGVDTIHPSSDLDCADPLEATGTGDCDDADPSVHPEAAEIPSDGVDQDCDGTDGCYLDGDGDGFGGSIALPSDDTDCTDPGESAWGTDCDDGDGSVYPGAPESTADGVDQDCDGQEVCTTDRDGDGWGVDALRTSPDLDCGGIGEADDTLDCDDGDRSVYPGAPEVVADGVDQSCDGSETCYADSDGDGYGGALLSSTDADCADAGEAPVGGDCDDANRTASPAGRERCNDVDDDCDGTVDEPDAVDASTWYADRDADGWGGGEGTASCDPLPGHVLDGTDCDDGSSGVHPGAEEVCNGVDDDCDGWTDGPLATDATSWYRDGDEDGYGAGLAIPDCTAPEGYVATSGDCADTDPTVHPSTPETCNGLDDDCDGVVDDGAMGSTTWYADADGDGWGDRGSTIESCSPPSGYVAEVGDCDDTRATAAPGADETCNDLDDDCDGRVDEAAVDAPAWYGDGDGDGFGDPSWKTTACDSPSGFVADGSDCDDADATVNPAAADLPYDGVDNDCDGADDCDMDRDGADSTVCGGSDCDDTNATIYPGAPELVDGLDNDCDGLAEDDDRDGDGLSDLEEDLLGTDPDDPDTDGDSIPDGQEVQGDTDGDGDNDALDPDDDGDGIPTRDEADPFDWTDPLAEPADTDGDGSPDHLDDDADGDGWLDSLEGASDTDGDGVGDWRDTDSDGDGVGDGDEVDGDSDADARPDRLDADDDNDGIGTLDEGDATVDTDADGIPDYQDDDSDGDGWLDAEEGATDTDQDGEGDWRDTDADADSIPDGAEVHGDTDADGTPDRVDDDDDGDGEPTADEADEDVDCDDTLDYLDRDESGRCGAADTDTGTGEKDEGCGCATGAPQVSWLLALAAVLGLRRRRTP